jgi:hypothetical protein
MSPDPDLSDNGWQEWRGCINQTLTDIRSDIAEVKLTAKEHAKWELALLSAITLATVGAVLTYILGKL